MGYYIVNRHIIQYATFKPTFCHFTSKQLSKVLPMRKFHIFLIYQGILQGCLNLTMSENLLNLLNRHSLINSFCSHCASEFMRMKSFDFQLYSFFQTGSNTPPTVRAEDPLLSAFPPRGSLPLGKEQC